MATTETVVLICDDPRHYDEAEATVSRTLVVDGEHYELELCKPHDDEYRAALSRFLVNARKIRPPAGPRGKRSKEVRQRTALVRAWWRNHPDAVPGVAYTDLGRIPASVTAEYERR